MANMPFAIIDVLRQYNKKYFDIDNQINLDEIALPDKKDNLFVDEVLKKLLHRQRQVIIGTYCQRKKAREIAIDIGMSESSVNKIHSESLKFLREILSKDNQ